MHPPANEIVLSRGVKNCHTSMTETPNIPYTSSIYPVNGPAAASAEYAPTSSPRSVDEELSFSGGEEQESLLDHTGDSVQRHYFGDSEHGSLNPSPDLVSGLGILLVMETGVNTRVQNPKYGTGYVNMEGSVPEADTDMLRWDADEAGKQQAWIELPGGVITRIVRQLD